MSSMGSLGGGSGGNVSLSGALPVGTNTIGNVDQTLATAGFDRQYHNKCWLQNHLSYHYTSRRH